MDRDVQDVVLQVIHQNCVETGQFKGVLEPSVELSQLGLDSLKLVEVVYAIETHFSIQFSEDTLYRLTNVKDLVSAVEAYCTEEVL